MTKPLSCSATPRAATICAAAAILGAAVIAAPDTVQAQHGRTGETRTVRSDGTVAPQVSQTPRREQRRQSRITTTAGALPAPDSWQAGIDPPEGGGTVAPAGTVAGDGAGVPLVGVVDIPLRPATAAVSPPAPPATTTAAGGGNR